jgi:hypothetical protein
MPFVGAAIAAIGGAIGGVLAAGGIGAALIKIGGSLLLSVAAQALMPKPKQQIQARTVTIREPVTPRDLVYGRARKGGTIIFLHASDSNPFSIFGFQDDGESNNKNLDLIIVLAGHQVESIGAVYFEGEEAVSAAGVVQGRWSGKVTLEKALGAADQVAFPGLRSALPGLWTDQHRLAGCAAIRLRLKYDTDAFPSGIPNITVDVEGKNDIWDPRTETFGYSRNPALCLADFMADEVWGVGAGIGEMDGIDVDRLVEAANICDEEVALAAGGVEPRYTCDGVISLAEAPKTIIEGLLSSFAGRAAYSAGVWRIMAGAWLPASADLSADDVRSGGFKMATRITMSSNFNAVRGQFVSPENDWQADDFPAIASDVYLAEDNGERRWKDISLPFTISAPMAQRLAKIELESGRRQLTVRVGGKLQAWRASVGDCVNFSYSRWGFAPKPFVVHGVSLDISSAGDGALLLPELLLRETSPLVYDWDASEEQIYAAAPRTNLPSAFSLAAPGSPAVTESLYVTRDGAGVKARVQLEWEEAGSAFVAEYRVEARFDGGAWVERGRTSGRSLDVLDVEPGPWEFRVKAVSLLGVSSEWAVASQEIFGLGALPVALTNVTLQTVGGLAFIKWDQHPDLDVRLGGAIVIRHSAALAPGWSGSVGMDEINGAQTNTAVPLKPGAYILRARDAGGRLGPAVSVSTTGAQALAFVSAGLLQADSTFSGAHAGTAGLDGVLRLDAALPVDDWGLIDEEGLIDSIGGMVTSGVYTFAAGLDFGSVRPVRLRSDIEMTAVDVLDLIDSREALIDTWPLFDGADGGEVDVILEARVTDDDPSGSPSWSDWSRVDNTEISARGVQARAQLSSSDSIFTPAVSRLRLYADEVA